MVGEREYRVPIFDRVRIEGRTVDTFQGPQLSRDPIGWFAGEKTEQRCRATNRGARRYDSPNAFWDTSAAPVPTKFEVAPAPKNGPIQKRETRIDNTHLILHSGDLVLKEGGGAFCEPKA